MSILQMKRFMGVDPEDAVKLEIAKAIVARLDVGMPVNELAKKFTMRPPTVRALQRGEVLDFPMHRMVELAARAGVALTIGVQK